ncbi:glycosyltransferase family 2 protein [Parapedobacter sp. ISTM3]|uniref:Glycosyl transferase family 2 n=1 Tax=Parapedobacter luteus TaxID=623280 RepID=A0A1T5A6J5_9SPHI|nr:MULTISPECIES: glycosyltransferase family 2 protein [Parapedobacter]MBK1442226.1 glycosyltransferase family 2 protein [Parapedobacter sp. ISTM3]SKB30642.1 Glycosyl transferase family 2 [Parapedobacter luteus]
MNNEAKIIVLTPIKNEDWILHQFLTLTSLFADCIIVADQQSSDRSAEICRAFPKVIRIENNSKEFNEDHRQLLLIETARRHFPKDTRLLLGLDADELVSADSLEMTQVWARLKRLPKGTSLHFERPDILYGNKACIRGKKYAHYFPLGYIDDGSPHQPDLIHSRRVPNNPSGEHVYVEELKFMHFFCARLNLRLAKLRYYSALENIKHTSRFYLRRYIYSPDTYERNYAERIEPLPESWINYHHTIDVDLNNFPDPSFNWQDLEVLKLFKTHGCKRFHLDNIWSFDWELLLQQTGNSNGLYPSEIQRPAKLLTTLLSFLDKLYLKSRKIRNLNLLSLCQLFLDLFPVPQLHG